MTISLGKSKNTMKSGMKCFKSVIQVLFLLLSVRLAFFKTQILFFGNCSLSKCTSDVKSLDIPELEYCPVEQRNQQDE